MRRLSSRAFLWVGAGFFAFVVFGWLARLGSNLSWDESLNLKIYARHPLAAIGLYREPNNHLLDSLWKSLFYLIPGLNRPFFHRLPNFLYIAFYLYAVIGLIRDLVKRGAPLAGCVAGVMLISASLIQWQMYNMRGYLAGIVVGIWGLRYLICRCQLLSDEHKKLDKRGVWGVAVYLTLLNAAVPTNAPFGVVQVLLVAGFLMAGAPLWKRVLQLGLRVVLLTVLTYTPIVISILTGISEVDDLGGERTANRGAEFLRHLQSLAPEGTPEGIVQYFFLAIGLLFVFAARNRLAWFGLLLAALSFGAGEASRFLLMAPARTLGPMGVPIFVGCGLVLFPVVKRWNETLQHVLGIAFMTAVACVMFPYLTFGEPSNERMAPSTECAASIETLMSAHEKPFLILTENNLRLHPYLVDKFGAENVVLNRREFLLRTGRKKEANSEDKDSWKSKLKEAVFPKKPGAPIDLERIRTVLIVRESTFGDHWFKTKEAVAEVAEGRKLLNHYKAGPFRIQVYGPRAP